MSLWKIAWRSIQQRAVASWLTGLSMALGVALVVAVLVIHGVVARSFTESAQGYHLILGAKGGKLQLVLNTVFHLSQPIENIPYGFYKDFTVYTDDSGNLVTGKYASVVNVVVPYCLGDSYQDFRVVGTTPELFDKLSYGAYDDGTPIHYEFAQGENFQQNDFLSAVIGSVAASQTGLQLGSRIPITHGLAEDENSHIHENELFRIVGILQPTGTPNDRAIFVNMEGFYLIDDHARPVAKEEHSEPADHHDDHDDHQHVEEGHVEDAPDLDNGHAGHVEHDHNEENHAGHDHGRDQELQPLPEEQREVTAILIETKNDIFAEVLANKINEGNIAQAVFPIREVGKLFEGLVGHVQKLLLILAALVVVVAGIGVMVSIYTSMSERSREIAVMRALGASRWTVMMIVLLESILLSLLGGAAGVLIGHGAIALLSPLVVSQTGVSISILQFEHSELYIVPALVILASVVGYLPALTAYRTDVARALSAAP